MIRSRLGAVWIGLIMVAILPSGARSADEVLTGALVMRSPSDGPIVLRAGDEDSILHLFNRSPRSVSIVGLHLLGDRSFSCPGWALASSVANDPVVGASNVVQEGLGGACGTEVHVQLESGAFGLLSVRGLSDLMRAPSGPHARTHTATLVLVALEDAPDAVRTPIELPVVMEVPGALGSLAMGLLTYGLVAAVLAGVLTPLAVAAFAGVRWREPEEKPPMVFSNGEPTITKSWAAITSLVGGAGAVTVLPFVTSFLELDFNQPASVLVAVGLVLLLPIALAPQVLRSVPAIAEEIHERLRVPKDEATGYVLVSVRSLLVAQALVLVGLYGQMILVAVWLVHIQDALGQSALPAVVVALVAYTILSIAIFVLPVLNLHRKLVRHRWPPLPKPEPARGDGAGELASGGGVPAPGDGFTPMQTGGVVGSRRQRTRSTGADRLSLA